MSLFGDYIKERCDREIIETDYGFLTYSFTPSNECYVEDMFIAKSHRHKKYGYELMNQLFMIAKERKATSVYTTVVPSTNGSSYSVAKCLQYGFQLLRSETNLIYLIKYL